MQAALPQPDPAPHERPSLHLLPPLPATEPARRPPSRLQALVVLLVLPLALIATAVIVRPPRSAARPDVLVVGPVASMGWAHDSLEDLGPVIMSSTEPSAARQSTEIHYRGPAAREQAEAVRRSLGRGRLIDASRLEESFPVIVYLGKDTPTQ